MKLFKLNRKWIDPRAVQMVRTLQDNGFETYLVGGCVRDLLLGTEPKDFDIATTARPRQIKKLIRNAYIIGRRFRLVLVKDGDDQFEISTFRRNPTKAEEANPEISDDNLFGTSEQDAYRRDFTMNALFYDPIKEEVIDLTETGIRDVKDRKINIIGDPDLRLPEDPIRILRAFRFSHKNNCEIPTHLKEKLSQYALLLPDTALPRRREEILKILRLKDPVTCLFQLYDLEVLNFLTPSLYPLFEKPKAISLLKAYFKKWDANTRNECEPYELFSLLILPLCFSTGKSVHQALSWIKSENIQALMKFELGMFNNEIHALTQALKKIPELQDIESYKQYGHKQQIDFLKQKSFGDALNFAELCSLLPPTSVDYWSTEYLNCSQKTSDKL